MRLLDMRSDTLREAWLDRMLKTARLSGDFGAGLLPESLVNRGLALGSAFPAALAAKIQALSTRHQQVLACDANLAELAKWCRSFWRMLKARALVLDHSSEIFKIYGLDTSGKFLTARYKRDWLKYAGTMIKAEAVAVARGYPAMDLPKIAVIETALADAEASCQGVDRANLVHQAALTDLKAARDRVDELRGDVYAYLRFALRSLSPSRRREVMRRYGFVFSGDLEQNSSQDPPPSRSEIKPEWDTPSARIDDDPLPMETPPEPDDETNKAETEPGLPPPEPDASIAGQTTQPEDAPKRCTDEMLTPSHQPP
ncbi:MAG: hypothetical protein QNK37_02825 [Acidobacteriota bacterium]|nr:hypothetical protein [Acidobacteriota bacterium]